MSWVSSKEVELGGLRLQRPAKGAMWETFPFLERYYGGIRTLVPRSENKPEYPRDGEDELQEDEKRAQAQKEAEAAAGEGTGVTKRDTTLFTSNPYNPYPDWQSSAYLREYPAFSECFLDEEKTVRIPNVRAYNGTPQGFPRPVMGSNELLGIKDDVCLDRFGRLGPYGLGYGLGSGGSGAATTGHREGAEDVWKEEPEVDYRTVRWAKAQERCLAANSKRFKPLPAPRENRFWTMHMGDVMKRSEAPADFAPMNASMFGGPPEGKTTLPRTAVVIRIWHQFHFTAEDILYLRSLISELSLLSGGEYVVHFLVHVKDEGLPIWADEGVYQRTLDESLPEEFRGMATLWSEKQMSIVYPALQETWARDLPVHGVYRSTFMPMQYFAFQHPEFDFFWNWEMDIRYTGQWYHLFDSVISWAKKQPRKGLWERSSRFYVPEVHGTWEDFSQMVRVQTEMGTNSANNMWTKLPGRPGASRPAPGAPTQNGGGDKPIWGPEPPDESDLFETDSDPVPPHSYEKDKYEWGVDEEADLITFNPMFDPDSTTWLLAEDVTGYNITSGLPPRRTAIITASRLSRRLLMTMHRETSLKRHTMFSEMWPASVALQHGFKAVYAPHAVYIDRRWPLSYLASVFNGGRNGASGGSRTSVFGDREHNFRGTTWYYSAGFSPNLWRRWLGYRVDGNGGEEVELNGEGRMCLPPMLLHPVKGVEMVIEGLRGG